MGPLALLGALTGGIALLNLLIAAITEPTSLTADGTVSKDGETPASPRGLAKGAGLDRDTYALARMGHSEAGVLPTAAQAGVMWAAYNRARARGMSVSGMLLFATRAGNGYFGKQSQGRYASTSQDPTATSRTLATAVMRGQGTDPTGGAQQWDSPEAFADWNGTSSAEADAVAAARQAAGNVLVTLPGIPETQIRFWRPA